MSVFTGIKNVLKKSPLFRTFCLLFVIGTILLVLSLIGKKVARIPVIDSISPELGLPGDIMTIKGHKFGMSKDNSYVSVGGSKITESSCILWTDTEIQIKLPANVQDGLVFVGNASGKSEPAFFADKSSIPVLLRLDPETSIPAITSMTSSAKIGSIITISGKNFGAVRGTSKVYFTANREDLPEQGALTSSGAETFYIAASESDFDYVLWTDSEIQVRVPDGAMSGHVYVSTDKGTSGIENLVINTDAGKKSYYNKHTFVIQVGVAFESLSQNQEGLITLYAPKPAVSSMQPSVEVNDCSPEPLIKDDPHNMIFQKQLNSVSSMNQRYNQTYVVTTYSVRANIIPEKIKEYRDVRSQRHITFTSPDACIPSANETIINLKNAIVGKEKRPYKKARLIYDYMLENYKLEKKVRAANANPLDLLRRKTGDAYDFAVVFTALCRAAGIPSVPLGGIFVDKDSQAIPHWWSEIYFEDYGWFTVDVVLGAGFEVHSFVQVDNCADYYFGNCDSEHIAFSRGWNQIRTSLSNGRDYLRTRTYALQSVWEEVLASNADKNGELEYKCEWFNPVVTGIY